MKSQEAFELECKEWEAARVRGREDEERAWNALAPEERERRVAESRARSGTFYELMTERYERTMAKVKAANDKLESERDELVDREVTLMERESSLKEREAAMADAERRARAQRASYARQTVTVGMSGLKVSK